MNAAVLIDEAIHIPPGIGSLDDFRRWARSDEFPRRGRIDYIDGRIEVDMSPDNVFLHSSPKSEIGRVVGNRVQSLDLGHFFIDRTRVSSPQAVLSAEPDVVVVSFDAVRTGQVRFIETKQTAPDSYIELEGGPELVVEVLIDSSEIKDTERLFEAYFAAGVEEYWLADARGPDLRLTIHTRGPNHFVPLLPDANGFQQSNILAARYRFERHRARDGNWRYRLVEAK